MPSFVSGHFRIFWYALFDAAARIKETDENDRDIIIISPWISDVTTADSGWSETAITSAFDPHAGGNIESLSDVLGKLVQVGYNVTVVTLSTVGKWLPKRIDRNLDNEKIFMEKISQLGVKCMVRNNVHMKYVKTPFCTFSGSVNISFNGLSGRTQEGAYYFVKSTHQQDFYQTKQHVDSTLIGAKDYFTPSIPITEWIAPRFDNFPNVASPNLENSGALYAPTSTGEYPGMTPEGYIPPGQIGGTIGNQENKSMIAQCSQLIVRIEMWVTKLISEDSVEGKTVSEIRKLIFPNADGHENNDLDERELLPDLTAMRRLLLSDNYDEIKNLKIKLGIYGNDMMWTLWSGLVTKLFNGLNNISNKIHNDMTLTKEDSEVLDKITNIFDTELNRSQ
tara:strand:- start:88 stop:1266 length:1179 start_codon:yes stop_codon:yes gene_type:complete